MIAYPINWKFIGQPIILEEIRQALAEVICNIDGRCKNLSLSGGIDSSLMLYFMTRIINPDDIKCYTIALNTEHPDYIFANMVAKYFGVKCFTSIPHNTPIQLEDDFPGDEIVRAFYENLSNLGVTDIISCDGIDEFTAGYYAHMEDPTEEIYYKYLEKLRDEQLNPLNKNSGDVRVYLPYMASSIIRLLSQIPLKRKCDKTHRKKIMFELAKGNLPKEILTRRKYGFCDAMRIK